ncbi:unnamed protein product [Allacma fusca]|nr:unnamed protein product [Allacma fusca]
MVELSDSPDYQWGMEIGAVKSAAYLQLSQSTNSVYQKIFKGIQILPSSYACFKRCLKENFACIDWEPGAHYMIPRNFSDKYGRHGFVLSKDLAFFNQLSLAMRRGNLIRQHIEKVIESLREMGLVSQWRVMDVEQVRRERIQWEGDANVKRGGEDKDPDVTQKRNISKLYHLLGSFYVVIFGLSIALVYFSIELLIFYSDRSVGVFMLNACKEFPAGKLIMLL